MNSNCLKLSYVDFNSKYCLNLIPQMQGQFSYKNSLYIRKLYYHNLIKKTCVTLICISDIQTQIQGHKAGVKSTYIKH
jgi:hypothetical protein